MSGRIVNYYDQSTECEGYFSMPESSNSAPLVLVAHTWKGRSEFEDGKVIALNNLGYAALSIDIFGGGINGSSTEENQALIEPFVKDRKLFRQRLISAVEFGQTIDGVDPSKIALIGFCFGGLAAIELARSGYQLSGCVSFHGLLNQSDEPLQKVNTKLLVLHGDKDPMVSSDQILALQNEMTESKADWQFISYGNTYHAFTNPIANDIEMGTVYNHDSDMRSWAAMSNFLEEVLAMLTSELRAKFLEYFNNNGHEVVDSSPLIPANDDTLLFTNAGMVQFKDVFLGSDKRSYKRATTTQRCIRAGGKHNDLENVGYTLRHHTFFEMLGNFSFGDYFKEEAIKLAWNFLTNELNLEKEKLWISVFREDDEAAEIWSSIIGIDPKRIVRLDEEDNFWSMGDTGPCGPCSEIYYDHGEQYEGTPPGSPGDEGDRFVEIWNLVFMQFNRDAAGELTPLPKPSVDTGMGLERVAAVMQGVNSNYETDLFLNLIKASENAIQSPGEPSHKVIADHIRSVSFLIADGITPSNEGRGYVLRRIMRRAIRHGYKLGAKEPFLHSLVEPLVKEMQSAFPMLAANQKHIEETIHNEENQFLETLDKGIEILEKEISHMDLNVIPGNIVFKLHDTFGFPFDLTADIAREQGLKLDEDGFNQCMEEQVKNSKSASKFKSAQLDLSSIEETRFLGYDQLNAEGKVLGLWENDLRVDSVTCGAEYFLVLDQSPFYAESGGQVGDEGEFTGSNVSGQVLDCIKQGKIFIHKIVLEEGSLKIGDTLKLSVASNKRASAASNHSATHLMHAALKHVLGSHVEQKGSLVDASKLRFDFSHPKAVTKDEIKQIELLVNQHTLKNTPVKTELMKLDHAIASGAEAMFGEKYDDEVRVLSMSEGFSVELCGGTHVNRTGDIGMFAIINESSVSSGVRRIEAVTGFKAVELMLETRSQLQDVQGILNVGAPLISSKVQDLVKENKSLKKGKKNKTKTSLDLKETIHKIDNFDLVLIEADSQNIQDLRQLVDNARQDQLQRCILILSHQGSKVLMVCGITDDIQSSLSAHEVIQAIAKASNGKGGGREDFAQGAGITENFEEFVNSIPDIVQSIA